jgi:hypothetical protein
VPALFIVSESAAQSWRVWPDAEIPAPGSIQEGRSYLFELRDVGDAIHADLFIDDSPLEALRSRNPRDARWRWSPGFHAGVVEALLKMPGQAPRRFEVITDPDVRKLTRGDFDVMVREILEDTFALFSLSGFRKGLARGAGGDVPPLARLEFLRSRVDEIVETVAAIATRSRRRLSAEERPVPYYRATGATGPEVLRSFRSGRVLTAARKQTRLPKPLRGHLPATIRAIQRRGNLDIPEHRAIRSCLVNWASWLRSVADRLEALIGEEEVKRSARAWALRTRRLSHKLSALLRLQLFEEVSDAPTKLMPSAIFRNDALYRRFFRLYQDMTLGISALFGDFLQMPLAKTFELYELWCFLRLVRAATELFGLKTLDVSRLFITDASGGVTIAAGAVIVPIGKGYALCFQKSYREFWLEPDKRGSYSRVMTPDIVLTQTADGQPFRLVVLDAKYRIADGLNAAISSIHTYRDALVEAEDPEGVRGIVSAAYLIAPYLPLAADDYREAEMPGRLFHPDYRRSFRFGAATLKPGMTSIDIAKVLNALIEDATVV